MNECKLSDKLVIVSNRVPYNLVKIRNTTSYKKSVGGLVTALDPIMRKNGGEWIGWNGLLGKSKFQEKFIRINGDIGNPYMLKFVNLTKKEINEYYLGFSNRTLWPLLHSFIFQTYFNTDYWKTYQKTNKKFACEVLEEITGNEIVWIHDYHLALLPGILRNLLPEIKLLFFFHVPFPSYEIFRILPWNREILEGMLGSNLIGFQTKSDAVNFLSCCQKLLNLKTDYYKSNIEYKERKISVISLPISIDYENFNKMANKNKILKAEKKIKRTVKNYKLVLSVERLDYTKGIKERLRAIDYFLEKYPEYIGKILFIQISVPSRSKIDEYVRLKKEIDEMIGNINGKYARETWTPIIYLYKIIPQEKLVAYYKVADVCMITSLRDGMNLVAKEYVSCKLNGEGVLILSKFAGAADEMRDHVILINPYDIEEIGKSINIALNYDEEEKKKKIFALQNIIAENNIFKWLNDFISYFYKNTMIK